MKVTKNNYFDYDVAGAYMSASFIKQMMQCEAQAIAEMRGEWVRPYSSALMVGSYVDAAFDGPKTFENFVKLNARDIFKKDGSPRAEFVKANEMIDRAKSDKTFMEFMRGQKQKILTGEIDGVPFRCKMDVYKKGERIVDLKTVRDMKPMYRPGEGRVSFADYWRWPIQLSIYQHLEGHHLPCYLAVITKEDPADLAIVQVEQERLDAEMEILRQKLPRYDAIRKGIIEPERCECCEYCRATKKLSGPITLTELEFENYE